MTQNELNTARSEIASRLRDRRIALGMSQQRLADLTGLSLRTIQSAEYGKFWLGMKQYVLLCHALELDI